jgi:hypothetical protein
MNPVGWIKKHPVAAFFVLGCAISWAVLVPLAVMGEKASSYSLPVVVMCDFGPALAALLMVRVTEGQDGLRQWAGRLSRWRVHVGWHAEAFLGPFLLVIVGYGLYLVFGGSPALGWQPRCGRSPVTEAEIARLQGPPRTSDRWATTWLRRCPGG